MIVPRRSTRKLLEQATDRYAEQLEGDEEALTYLEGRGITKQVRDYFRLGVVRNPISGQENYRDRISFPYVTPTGVVSIRFRVIGDQAGARHKFLSLPGDITRLYNSADLIGAGHIYLCEGETDTIAAHGMGLPAVGLPGASAWQASPKVWARVFANRNVIVLADNDDLHVTPEGDERRPGMDFAQAVYRTLGGCNIVVMDEGYDVSKLVHDRGPEALRQMISRGR